MNLPFHADLEPLLRRRLENLDRRVEPVDGLKRAAVVLLVVPEEDRAGSEASLILTQRAFHLKRHAGQYALPGGRLDPGETPVQAALRETEEEIGLAFAGDRVLGLLDDYVTRSGYHLTPVAVWGAGAGRIVPSPDEVAAVHRVPLALLADPATRHLTAAETGPEPVLSLAIVETLVFAPTAAVMLQLARLAVTGEVERVHRFEEPRFAWK